LSSVERDGAQLCADASFVRTHESYRRLFRFISAPVHPRRSAQSNDLEAIVHDARHARVFMDRGSATP